MVTEAAASIDAFGLKPNLEPLLPGLNGSSIQPDLAIRSKSRTVALGDAKYKDLIAEIQRRGANELSDITKLSLRTGDQYQMYTYMRLEDCGAGFIILPFWHDDAPAVSVSTPYLFRRSPLDGDTKHGLRILGLNLMAEPVDILREGCAVLSKWYADA